MSGSLDRRQFLSTASANAFLWGASISLLACGSSGGPAAPPPPPPPSPPPSATVETVTLVPATASVVVGGTRTLTATLRNASGDFLSGHTIAWTSGADAIATVSSTGVVTGVSAGGPVTITATSEGKSGTAQVTVTTPPQPVPAELQDNWHANLFTDTSPTLLVIGALGYSVSRPGESTTVGLLVATGPSTVRASGSTACSGVGSYIWTIVDNTLIFVAADHDDCSRRTEILTGQPWTRGN